MELIWVGYYTGKQPEKKKSKEEKKKSKEKSEAMREGDEERGKGRRSYNRTERAKWRWVSLKFIVSKQ